MMSKKLNDIDVKNLDLSLHKILITSGTVLYRVVKEGRDPLTPSGKECRFAKEPPQYNPAKYAEAYKIGQASAVGTGATCFTFVYSVALQESYAENPVGYKVTLNTDIEAVDMDLVCAAEGVVKPYTTEDRDGIWHEFYGRKIKALRYESLKDNKQYNLVMFPDWIKDFKNIFTIERV